MADLTLRKKVWYLEESLFATVGCARKPFEVHVDREDSTDSEREEEAPAEVD